MTTPLENIATALASFLAGETPLPSNAEPPTPDNTLTLYLPGSPPGSIDFGGGVQEDRTLQLRFRDKLQGTLQARTEAAYEALKAWRFYAGAGFTVRLKAVGSPLYAYPKDSNGRSIASFNVTVMYGN